MVLVAGKTVIHVWALWEYACVLKWNYINTLHFLSFPVVCVMTAVHSSTSCIMRHRHWWRWLNGSSFGLATRRSRVRLVPVWGAPLINDSGQVVYTRTSLSPMVKWRHSNVWSHYDLRSLCYGATRRTVWSGEDRNLPMSCYSDKIETFGLRKCPCYQYLTKNVISL